MSKNSLEVSIETNKGKAIKGNLKPEGDFSVYVRRVLKSTGALIARAIRGGSTS